MIVCSPKRKWFLLCLVFIFLFTSIPVWADAEGLVKGSIVNVRQGPGLTYSVIAQVSKGQNFPITDESGDWYKIRLHTAKEGWIHKSLIENKFISETTKQVVVQGTVANVRNGPGVGYSSLGQVKAGDVLQVIQEKDGWILVNAPSVGQAWIAGWLVIEKKSTATQASYSENTAHYLMINKNVVNIRTGPSTNYTILTKVGLNEKHLVLEQKDGWFKIQIGAQQGWVSGEVVQYPVAAPTSSGQNTSPAPTVLPEALVVTGNIVNLRTGPDLQYAVQTKVYQGERLLVLAKQGDWYQVQVSDGQKGWIAGWLTEQTSTVTPSRGSGQELEVLSAPLIEGKSFKILDNSNKAILLFNGWTSQELKIETSQEGTIISIKIPERTNIQYQSKLPKLGINDIQISSPQSQGLVKLTFAYPVIPKVTSNDASKETRVVLEPQQVAQGLAGRLIVIDPGHASVQPGGWLDPGAVGPRTGLYEKDVNLSVALKLKTLLENEGARVIMTHTGSTELSLLGRAEVANQNQADIFVSIHANSSNKLALAGHSTYYYGPSNDSILGPQRYQRQKLATLVQREMVKAAGRKDMGIYEDNFAVLRETRVPSILVETAYLSDGEEEILLGQDPFRQKLAIGIFNGIKAYFQ